MSKMIDNEVVNFTAVLTEHIENLKPEARYRILKDFRLRMANYAFAACIDSDVRKEAEKVCGVEV